MTALLAIVSHTPRWVFVVFALLLLLGIQALRPRTIAVARVFATPAVFIAWGLVSLALAAESAPQALVGWSLTAVAGASLALLTLRLDGLRAEGGGRVHLPGSPLPLMRNVLIFAAKYVLAVLLALHPAARSQLLFWDMAVSGASAGYFIGWTVRFLIAYRRAAAAAALPVGGGGG
ncbi:MAG TPA: DUF6622 family protein [Stellaceae bacterium]|jgi:hypothetical protein|nr:DUF6622 family protein [Stellaceae bacterium]